MTAITFDTLRFSKRLRDAGVPEKHAEAEAEALSEVFEVHASNLATKQDLKELELRIHGELSVMKWMLGILVAGVISLILKAFFI